MTDEEKIAEWIRINGVTECPTVGSPELRAYELAKEKKRAALYCGRFRSVSLLRSEWGWTGLKEGKERHEQ